MVEVKSGRACHAMPVKLTSASKSSRSKSFPMNSASSDIEINAMTWPTLLTEKKKE